MAGGDSRQRILEAMAVVVGRKGYRATTVGDVIGEAGVSRTTFYKHFDDKHSCFLAAYELVAERVVAAAAECGGQRSWLSRARSGLDSLVRLLAADPGLARTAVVEAAVAGAEAQRLRHAAVGRLARMLEAGRDRGSPTLPAYTGLMAVSAVGGLLFDEIQAGRAAELPDRLPELLFALLVPYLGPREAAERMGRPLAYRAASR